MDVRVTAVDGTGGILARGRAGADGVANVEIDRAPGPFRFWANSYYVISQVYPSHLCDDLNCTDEVLLGGILNMPEEGLLQLTMPMSSRAPVRGRIVEAVTGNGVEYARVSFRRVGTAPTSTYDIVTDEQGYYDFANVVHPGQYFVHAGSGEHVDELYPEIVCQGPFQLWNCGEGTAITIPLGGLEGLDFELNRSATITGSLTESGQPYVGTSLTFALLDNDLISEGGGNSFSSTYELDDIIPGTYRLGLRSGYSTTPIYPMLYDAIYCDRPDDEQYPFENCPVGAGEVITLVSGEERTGVDFEIKSFNGRMVEVTRSDTGAPLAAIALDLWSTQGNWIAAVTTNAAGRARVTPYSVSFPGEFLLSTSNGLNFIDEVFDDIQCPEGSAFFGLCSLAGADLLSSTEIGPNAPPLRIRLSPRDSDVLMANRFGAQ